MAKKLSILLIILISFVAITNYFILSKTNTNKELMTGGDVDHLYHFEGQIVEISDDTKIITVELKEIDTREFSFNSNIVYLDYSKVEHIDDVNVADIIVFYFFKWHVDKTNIEVHSIYLVNAPTTSPESMI